MLCFQRVCMSLEKYQNKTPVSITNIARCITMAKVPIG
ncbi:hypothetical protein [Runella sp. MFBS21]